MELGTFSISLNVKNIEASQIFYGALGFAVVGGDTTQGWFIFRNGTCAIGLFKEMLEKKHFDVQSEMG